MEPKREPYQLNKQEEDASYDSNVNPFDDKIEEDQQQQPEIKKKKLKKTKKTKKEKKLSKKKKKMRKESDYENEEQQQQDEINSMFQDEAQSGDEDEQDDEQAQIGYEEEKRRFQELYKRPNATEKLMERLEGKNQKQINAQYSKKAFAFKQSQELLPGQKDPRIFVVHVKPREQDMMVIKILNKAKHLANQSGQIRIVSAISLRKKYPGRIFVEAFSESDVYQGLQGFNDVYFSKKILPLQFESYESLFSKPVQNKIQFKQNNFVRVKKGLYQGDLAKVFKVKKSSIDVMLVPRINVTDIKRRILKQTQGIEDEQAKQAKKQELLKLFTNHKQKNYKQRPSKRQLYQQDFSEIKQFPGIKSIRLGSINGLILLNYAPYQLQKVYGTYLPVQIMPFTSEGKFVEEMKQDFENMATSVNFKKGQDVEIIGGELQKHYGTLVQIKGNVGVIRCKNKDLKGQILQQPLQYIAKRFKQGERVKVISGVDKGKTGLIILVQPKMVQIWTENSNSIRVSKKNLQVCTGQTICTQNVHQLKKDDLIKTNKNRVGVVLETSKDNIKIITTDNVVQVISNMDFDEKITIRNLVAKNKVGQEIKQGAIVFVREGQYQGKRCRVVHVYRQHVFMFNESFNKSAGIIVQFADNCSLLSKNDIGRPQLYIKNQGQNEGQYQQGGDRIQVGATITLKTGSLKGYRGVIKSIQKDKIQVRVLSKACTQWVPRSSLIAKVQENVEAAKTPSRLYGSMKGMSEQPNNQSPVEYNYD